MDFKTLADILALIEKHGLSLVLLIFMGIYWFIPWIKRLQKKEDENDDYDLILQQREREQELVGKILAADSEINVLLCEMLEHFEAQWTTLWQFHNGISSIGGVPFLKISATHERTTPDVTSLAHLYKDMPVSLFLDEKTSTFDKEIMSVYLVDPATNSAIKNIMRSAGISKTFIGTIRGLNGGLLGVITLSFRGEIWLSDEEYGQIRSYSSRAAIALSNLVSLTDESKKLNKAK